MRARVASGSLAIVLACVACGGGASSSRAPQAAVTDVVVVLRGAGRPLPFDPRVGRIGAVTRELQQLLGHPVVLELEAALAPDHHAHLEETALASFETLARELVLLERHDKALFQRARLVERVVCSYDAVAKHASGRVADGGKTLLVSSPPDGFPLLAPGVATEALLVAYGGDLHARYAAVDPAKLPRDEHGAYFDYVTRTRPGVGYVWSEWRRLQNPSFSGEQSQTIRLEHVGKVLRLATVVEPKSLLERRVTSFLVEQVTFVGSFYPEPRVFRKPDPAVLREVVSAYERWLTKATPELSDEDTKTLTNALYGRLGTCSSSSPPDAVFPTFDAFAYGLWLYDVWKQKGAQGQFDARCVFTQAMRMPELRRRLADAILQRRDTRLLEMALLGVGHRDGEGALEFLELVSRDESLFRRGVRMLTTEEAAPVRDAATRALRTAAPRWWRDVPSRRGLALFVMAHEKAHLQTYYGDEFWKRWPSEFGGPVPPNVLGAYLAEGAPATEMVAQLWLALARTPERDELVASSLPVLLQADRDLRTTRTQPVLLLLRRRLCDERNASGLSRVRVELERWSRAHPEDAVSVSNAIADMAIDRCPKG